MGEAAQQECAEKDKQLHITLASMTKANDELSLVERELLEKERAIADVKMQMHDQQHCYNDLQQALMDKGDGFNMALQDLHASRDQLESLEHKLRSAERLVAEKEEALERLRH